MFDRVLKIYVVNVIYNLESNSRLYRHCCNSCIDAQAWGYNPNAFFIHAFYQDTFHKGQKGNKLLKNKNYLYNYLGSSFVVRVSEKTELFMILLSP